mmetsp:Transcript_22856/g.25430  ORF Transcript_22856/g.25430 Transcript_22856/m.25430 type:complete len:152 (-) Transcript_22856:175-630(-)
MARFLVIHGAGMNMRGKVNIEKFGPKTLPEYNNEIKEYAKGVSAKVDIFQSNVEGEVINKLYSTFDSQEYNGVVINPSGFTLGYRALSNAIKEVNSKVPVVEVHISNPSSRNVHSDMAGSCSGVIHGFGVFGYKLGFLALQDICNKIKKKE